MACQLRGKIIRIHDVDDIDEKAKYKLYEASLLDECDITVGGVVVSICDNGNVEIIIKELKDIRAEHGAMIMDEESEEDGGIEVLDEDGEPTGIVAAASKGDKKSKKGEIKVTELVDSTHDCA